VVVDGLRKTVGQVVREVVVGLQGRLVEDTPVDTGWAQSNWVPKVGSAFEGTAGTREDAEAGRLNQGVAAAGLAEVAGYDVSQGDVHVTNNVPYIEKLNAGSSAQAPAAFVQQAIVRTLDEVSR
jgi:uncharacterized protein CbrC (UPF0167 family)